MKLNKISTWENFETIDSKISNHNIRSWLLENGPITKRIKQNGVFRLHLIQDEFSTINQSDKDFIQCTSNKIKLREVLLYCDDSPIVFAQTIIPAETISKGLKQLGNLGSRPLGDILFKESVFTKDIVLYALFEKNSSLYWGRKAKYMVNGYKFSVMEVFLIDVRDE